MFRSSHSKIGSTASIRPETVLRSREAVERDWADSLGVMLTLMSPDVEARARLSFRGQFPRMFPEIVLALIDRDSNRYESGAGRNERLLCEGGPERIMPAVVLRLVLAALRYRPEANRTSSWVTFTARVLI